MRALLIIAFFIPFIFIGHLMSRLDKFLSKNSNAGPGEIILPAAIVLGKSKLALEVSELLLKSKIRVISLSEPFLVKPEQNLCYLFALSDSDADNIVLCKTGKKLYSIDDMISICNDKRNTVIFDREGIPYLHAEEADVKVIYETVLRETRVRI